MQDHALDYHLMTIQEAVKACAMHFFIVVAAVSIFLDRMLAVASTHV